MLEAHILACLTPSTQQLLLIGDHEQLRPKVQVSRALAGQLHYCPPFCALTPTALHCHVCRAMSSLWTAAAASTWTFRCSSAWFSMARYRFTHCRSSTA